MVRKNPIHNWWFIIKLIAVDDFLSEEMNYPTGFVSEFLMCKFWNHKSLNMTSQINLHQAGNYSIHSTEFHGINIQRNVRGEDKTL